MRAARCDARLLMRAIRASRGRAIGVGLIVVLAVVGFSLATLPGSALAAGAASPSAPAASTTPAAAGVASGPLTPLTGSGTDLSTTGPTTFGTVSVTPDPIAYNPNAPDSVTVTLTPTGNLANLVAAQGDVASPSYRTYLSAGALGAEYGNPSYADVVSYFSSYGLAVTPSATALTLTVSGTVGEISSAFHTTLSAYAQQYTSQGVWNPMFGNDSATVGSTNAGPVIYANTAPAELPSGIATAINGVAGLDGMVATPEIALPYGLDPAMNTPQANTSAACDFGISGSCSNELDLYQSDSSHDFIWTDFGPEGATCSEENICGDFQFLFPSTMPAVTGATSLWNGHAAIDSEQDKGQGITIALIEVGCAIPSDLSAWSNMTWPHTPNQLDNRLTQIALDIPGYEAFPNNNLGNCEDQGFDAGWTLETSLDIEYASAMAPSAHIDVIGIPYPGNFSAFDLAYADIAQYLSLGSTGGTCPSAATLAAAGLYVVQGTAGTGTCSVTITSNSYGSGEQYTYFYGSPVYLTAATEELELLNAVGVTNFFASGDAGGVYETVNDFQPADSPGATSVGGAEITAQGAGSEFPVTNTSFTYCDGYLYGTTCYDGVNATAYVASASGIGQTGYWSYGYGLTGTEVGATGGGFGQSFVYAQPWWQNAMDTYSTGAKIDPVVSLQAAFNETIYGYGEWFIFYGGTSFATPTMAGQWALIEEQANLIFGNPKMGDINPILYAAHNAFEAGALGASAYTPMGTTQGWDAAPVNSFTWYYYNLSIEDPSAPVQPLWFPSLGNPAGNGWNYLQGLGIPDPALLVLDLFGTTGAAGHSLANPAFSVLEVTPEGLVAPPTTLTAGTTYEFDVVTSNGQTGVFDVSAYSGQSNAGAYGGGVLTSIQTGANGIFNYTPTTGAPPGGDAATTYGYFLVQSASGAPSAEWAFDDFAVGAPTPSGTLTLCVVDAYGNCDQGVAEVTTFTTTTVGDYNLFGQAEVYLNGVPVSGAVVTQTSVYTQYGYLDPSLPPADYAPGVTLGTTISDARGEAVYWIDGFTAEHNGTLATDVYELTASYDGLTSNLTVVYAEPQSGSFYTGNLASSGTTISGTLTFAGMKYVGSINVSVGSGPGQYENWTCPLPSGATQPANTLALPGCSPFLDENFGADIWESGVDNGALPVNLSTAGLTGPVVLSIVGIGANDVSFGYCESYFGEEFCYSDVAVQNPLIWQDPVVFLPASLSASASGTVSGTDTISWSGAAYTSADGAELATGVLSLVWGGGSTVLATGLSGSYALDTTGLANGAYSVDFTETATGVVPTTRSVAIYVDNAPAASPSPTAPAPAHPSSSGPVLFGLIAGENLLYLVAALGVAGGAGCVYLAMRRRPTRPSGGTG